ncbi:hypothetical protein DFP72DRAFT_1059653 [Ephemerocybe angulata]|uniref:Uncharacterized protein n=1 Tax=Ephemerocybe angulata TaxID=980116 RepID=A0A8H6MGE5_9AGAR|nr:hypothetical protein DFP72DRAFT_1059653 [Tulosesus angulatus]
MREYRPHKLAFAPNSASGSLASGPPHHCNLCIALHRLLSTFNTVALLSLSTTPKTRSRSLSVRLKTHRHPTSYLEKALPRYICPGRLVLDHLTSKNNQRRHFTLRLVFASSSTTTPTSRSASTLLLFPTPLNSANRVPASAMLVLRWSTSPPPINDFSPHTHRAYGFFCTPTAPARLRRPAQCLK